MLEKKQPTPKQRHTTCPRVARTCHTIMLCLLAAVCVHISNSRVNATTFRHVVEHDVGDDFVIYHSLPGKVTSISRSLQPIPLPEDIAAINGSRYD